MDRNLRSNELIELQFRLSLKWAIDEESLMKLEPVILTMIEGLMNHIDIMVKKSEVDWELAQGLVDTITKIKIRHLLVDNPEWRKDKPQDERVDYATRLADDFIVLIDTHFDPTYPYLDIHTDAEYDNYASKIFE